MKYKHVQAIHELRMWTIAIATGVIAAKKYISSHPEAEEWVHNKVERVKSKFRKEKPEEEKVIKIVIVKE